MLLTHNSYYQIWSDVEKLVGYKKQGSSVGKNNYKTKTHILEESWC